MAVSKRLRFEIFRRDNHACRYCGRSAPEVVLTIDHVTPTTLGGTDHPGNLVAACSDCNSGKSATPPGLPVVEGASEDALRWARAQRAAAGKMLTDRAARDGARAEFDKSWQRWGFGKGKHRKPFERPTGWEQTIDSFLAAGLPMPVLLDCIDLAMKAPGVYPENTFRYMCGIGWKLVRELQEETKRAIAPAESVEVGPEADCWCSGAGNLAGAIHEDMDPVDIRRASDRARQDPREEWTYPANEVAETALRVVGLLFDDRWQLEYAIDSLLSRLPEESRDRLTAEADSEVLKAYGEGAFSRCDVLSNRVRYLSMWLAAGSPAVVV